LIGRNGDFEAELTWSPPATGRRGEARLRIEVTLKFGEECAILFGASGAGKTSILRLIAGLERPASGLIRLGDEILFDATTRMDRPLRHRRIGLIFQDDLLFPHLSVAENVRFGLKGSPRAGSERRVEEVVRLCGVEHILERRPETLSGGERQRVGLARALAPRPRLLLCDEPVSALDMGAREVLVDRLKAVQRAEGIPLLYVTHSQDEAITLGSRLFLLEAGRVVEEGPPLDILARSSGLSRAGVPNRFAATVEGQLAGAGESHVRIEGGPTLVVPRLERPVGSSVSVLIRADDILLARGPIVGLSARNLFEGRVERVIEHGSEAEVLVRTGGVVWIVSVVSPALGSLGLCAGVPVHMIIKARSCRVIPTLDGSLPTEK
jgi:molybdate transport system ATP-binding protein